MWISCWASWTLYISLIIYWNAFGSGGIFLAVTHSSFAFLWVPWVTEKCLSFKIFFFFWIDKQTTNNTTSIYKKNAQLWLSFWNYAFDRSHYIRSGVRFQWRRQPTGDYRFCARALRTNRNDISRPNTIARLRLPRCSITKQDARSYSKQTPTIS